jgi:hypothetical protein
VTAGVGDRLAAEGRDHLLEIGVALGVVGVEPLLALGPRALAGRADVHHPGGALDPLCHRERPRVQRVGKLLVVLGDHTRAAAVRAVELDELEVELGGDLRDSPMQLGGEAARDAAGPIRQLHDS